MANRNNNYKKLATANMSVDFALKNNDLLRKRNVQIQNL